MALFHKKPSYRDERGGVKYLDGSALARPIDMPKPQKVVMGVFVAVAAVIGVYLLVTVIGGMQASTEKSQTSVEENLSRPVALNLPQLAQLVELDDDAIRQTLNASGETIYEAPQTTDTGLDLVKLPSDVSLAEGGVLYAKGISSLNASDATRLLNGMWDLSVSRESGVNMRVRYADFTSGSLDAAVQSAIKAEGFDPATTPADGKGVDDAGNTYQSGTVSVNGTTYTWRVSAVALSSVYSVSGLPDSALYVGIRLSN